MTRLRKCSALVVRTARSGLVEHVQCARIATQTIGNKAFCEKHAELIVQRKRSYWQKERQK